MDFLKPKSEKENMTSIKSDRNLEDVLKTEHFVNAQNGFTDNKNISFTSKEDEIVISGMAGRFPSSDNVAELSEHLYNKVK